MLASNRPVRILVQYSLQGHHFRLTIVFRSAEESCTTAATSVGAGPGSLRRNQFLSFMCSSYRLSTVHEDPNDQSCESRPLNFGG